MVTNATVASTQGAGIRADIRRGRWSGHSSGLAPDLVQGHVVIVPERSVGDFLRYCQRNPKPFPLLAVSEPGEFMLDGGSAATRHPFRRATVPRLAPWRAGGRADRRARTLAR